MRISSLSEIVQSTYVQEERANTRLRSSQASTQSGDTVHFSEEALSLARTMMSRANVTPGGTSSEEEEKEKEQLFETASTGIILNGVHATEADLAKEIQKVQEEVDGLYAELDSIMGMEMDMEEKMRLSEPTNQKLEEKLELLGSLKRMQQASKTNKHAAQDMKDPLTGV